MSASGVSRSEVQVPSTPSGVTNEGLVGADAAFDAVDNPLEHAGVLAEARPQEAAVLAAAEPVDQEDFRHLVAALACPCRSSAAR